jgi:excisionase family DNA binding protein
MAKGSSNPESLYLRQLLLDAANVVNREPRLYTKEEVAKILKVGVETVRNLIWRSRTLRHCKIGGKVRIREKDLEEFIENQLVPCVFDQEVLK